MYMLSDIRQKIAIAGGPCLSKAILCIRQKVVGLKKIYKSSVDKSFEDLTGNWKKTNRSVAGWLRRVWAFLGYWNNRSRLPTWRKLTDRNTSSENSGQDWCKFWTELFENNYWNTVWFIGLGTVKTFDHLFHLTNGDWEREKWFSGAGWKLRGILATIIQWRVLCKLLA